MATRSASRAPSLKPGARSASASSTSTRRRVGAHTARTSAKPASMHKARVVALIRGQQVEVHRSGRQDRYRRTLANISVPAGDVGAILLKEGLARPYRPGKQAHWDRVTWWCGPGDWWRVPLQ